MSNQKDQAIKSSQHQINQVNLPAPDFNAFNLSIPFPTFGAVPFELIDQEFDRVGMTHLSSQLLYIRLFGQLDWQKTVRIGCHDFMLGITGYLSDKAIQKLLRCGSNKTAHEAKKRLLDTRLLVKLDKEKGQKCHRYQIALFGPILEFLKAHPPETVKVEYLAKNDVLEARLKHTQKNNPKSKPPPATMYAETTHNQDYKINTAALNPSIPSPAAARGEEGGENLEENSQKAKTPPAPAPSLPAEPAEATERCSEEKRSPKGKETLSSLSENSSSPQPEPASEPPEATGHQPQKSAPPAPQSRSKVSSSAAPAAAPTAEHPLHEVFAARGVELGERFHETFKNGYPTRRKAEELGRDCIPILNDLFTDPCLEGHFPDPDERASACVDVLLTAFKKLPFKKGDPDRTPKYPKYFEKFKGLDAISEAIPIVIRQHWEGDAEAEQEPEPTDIAEFLSVEEVELDPELIARWKQKHGKNWRRKRQEEMKRNTRNPPAQAAPDYGG